MKRKLFKILGITVLLSGIVAGAVYAFAMGNVDGVWSTIDGGGGATTDAWATGPAGGSSDYDNPFSIHGNDPGIQGVAGGTDWNQVRYGDVPDGAPVPGFGGRSGFGFDGVNDVYEGTDGVLAEGEEFLLGKWCHFNNPITSTDSFEYVDLTVHVGGIKCTDGSDPTPNTTDFAYRFTLDETTNAGTGGSCGDENLSGWPYYDTSLPTYECPYTVGTDPICPWDGGVNDGGCADRVDFGALAAQANFLCTYEGIANTEFSIQVVGFVPLADPTAVCPLTSGGSTPNIYFISQEQQDSCACLYARVHEVSETAVDLNYFTADENEQGVKLQWETTSEVDNLGFNLYRKQDGQEAWVKLNAELIPTVVYPGAPFGGAYSFVDTGVETGETYLYWLMDVDTDGTAKLNGPVEVSIPPK